MSYFIEIYYFSKLDGSTVNMLYIMIAAAATTTTTTTTRDVYPYLPMVLTIHNFEGNFYWRLRLNSAY